MTRGSRTDDITDECWGRNHGGCAGYTEPESDPSLRECQCHDDLADALAGEQ